MPIEKIDINHFIDLRKTCLVLDVRSPAEYGHAHIPGAESLPLFTDDERKVVGTAYKNQSRQEAIRFGLQYFGPKMISMIDLVESLVHTFRNDHPALQSSSGGPVPIIVHCWRGGMRSSGVGWLLDLYGFKVYTLVGGYKAYRNWARQQFEKDHHITLVGGFTGTGKTKILAALAQEGEAVVDLEALASHRGSAFGKIGMPDQPGQEMFENLLAEKLAEDSCNLTSPPTIWMEDESQRIGNLMIPAGLWKQMRACQLYFLDIPFEERLDFLVQDYGHASTEELVNAVNRIWKRLGGLEAKKAIGHLMAGDMKEAFRVLLAYYDKCYVKSLNQRKMNGGILVEIPYASPTANNAHSLIGLFRVKKEAVPC